MLDELKQIDPNRIELFEVIGRADAAKVTGLAESMSAALARGRTHLVIDLSGTQYMNSAGLRALVNAMRSAERQGARIFLSNPSERVHHLLQLVGLDSLYPIHTDKQDNLVNLPPDYRHALYQQTQFCC